MPIASNYNFSTDEDTSTATKAPNKNTMVSDKDSNNDKISTLHRYVAVTSKKQI